MLIAYLLSGEGTRLDCFTASLCDKDIKGFVVAFQIWQIEGQQISDGILNS